MVAGGRAAAVVGAAAEQMGETSLAGAFVAAAGVADVDGAAERHQADGDGAGVVLAGIFHDVDGDAEGILQSVQSRLVLPRFHLVRHRVADVCGDDGFVARHIHGDGHRLPWQLHGRVLVLAAPEILVLVLRLAADADAGDAGGGFVADVHVVAAHLQAGREPAEHAGDAVLDALLDFRLSDQRQQLAGRRHRRPQGRPQFLVLRLAPRIVGHQGAQAGEQRHPHRAHQEHRAAARALGESEQGEFRGTQHFVASAHSPNRTTPSGIRQVFPAPPMQCGCRG